MAKYKLSAEQAERYARSSKHDSHLCISCKDYLARLGKSQFYVPNTWIKRRRYADQLKKNG